MGSSPVKGIFVNCEKCGKKLIERRPNGILHFIFGKPSDSNNEHIPVEMFLQGNVKMKCLRRGCNHWQVINYLPNIFQSEKSEATTPEAANINQNRR
jgi:hypothetical protein